MRTVGTALVSLALVACGHNNSSTVMPDSGGGKIDAPGSHDVSTLDTPATPIPIKHVVVIVKENHTFDNYFGSFPGADGIAHIATAGGTITPPHAPDSMPRDLCHDHDCALVDWAGGAMNGFDNTSGTSVNGDNLAYAQYGQADIPNYWQYASHFTLADRFFANVLGPSFPGHTFVLAAQDAWATSNPDPTPFYFPYWGCDQDAAARVPVENQLTCTSDMVFPCFDIPSVPDVLPTGVDWKFYGTNFVVFPETWSMFDAIKSIRQGPGWSHIVESAQFQQDITNGTLPAVSWLVDQDLADEHPLVGSVCVGENWTVDHINMIMNSPYWADTAIIFTMDDFGGWYDHVAPPRKYGCDPNHPFGLGFRLPLIIMSPYAKPGFIFHEDAEQASIPRFIEKVFGAPALSTLDPAAQDGQANDLMNAFDFTQTPLPPLVLQQRLCL